MSCSSTDFCLDCCDVPRGQTHERGVMTFSPSLQCILLDAQQELEVSTGRHGEFVDTSASETVRLCFRFVCACVCVCLCVCVWSVILSMAVCTSWERDGGGKGGCIFVCARARACVCTIYLCVSERKGACVCVFLCFCDAKEGLQV